jgi:hypothetical protein
MTRDPAVVAAGFHEAQATVARILASTPADVRVLAGRLLDLQPNHHQEFTTMTLAIEPAAAAARIVGDRRRTHQLAPLDVGSMTRCGLAVDELDPAWEVVEAGEANCGLCEWTTVAAALTDTKDERQRSHGAAKMLGTSRAAVLRARGMSLLLAADALDGADHG